MGEILGGKFSLTLSFPHSPGVWGRGAGGERREEGKQISKIGGCTEVLIQAPPSPGDDGDIEARSGVAS